VFIARYGLIPYIKQITFRLLKVNGTEWSMNMECTPVGWWWHSLMKIRRVVHELLTRDTHDALTSLSLQNTVGKVKSVQECKVSTQAHILCTLVLYSENWQLFVYSFNKQLHTVVTWYTITVLKILNSYMLRTLQGADYCEYLQYVHVLL
jgi:hypothetical protein